MDSDLTELNRRIAKRIGLQEDHLSVFAGFLSICVARLKLSAREIADLCDSTPGTANPTDVIYINRDYLNYARTVAQGVRAGNFAGLLVLGISLQQANLIAMLSNEQITRIAKYAPGDVFEAVAPIANINRFRSSARPQFAAALIAA